MCVRVRYRENAAPRRGSDAVELPPPGPAVLHPLGPGFGFRVQGAEFRVSGSGASSASISKFTVQGLEFKGYGLGAVGCASPQVCAGMRP